MRTRKSGASRLNFSFDGGTNMKKTSKLIALLMVFALVFALAACDSEQPAQSDSEDLSAELEALLANLTNKDS